MPARLFVSYSHHDVAWKESLVTALRAGSYPGEIDVWEDTRLRGGDAWRDEIERAIGAAKIAVLLLSESFLASSFIQDEELPKIFQARIAFGTRLVPVFVSDIRSSPEWLTPFQRLPAYGVTLSAKPEAAENVAKEIIDLTKIDALPYLPFPGTPVPRSYSFAPVSMLGIRLNPEDPFVIDFMVDPGDAGPKSRALRSEVERLIRYFLVGLNVPESDIWVNLSPQEPTRVISPSLARTELGRDLLAQDYLLKQFNASAMHPDSDCGKRYWAAVNTHAEELGDKVAATAFSRVWIVPKTAEVIEQGLTAVVRKAQLGAELRLDAAAATAYSATSKFGMEVVESDVQRSIREWGSRVFAEVLLPELEAELNGGRHFATTRQAFGALVLARWFKLKVHDAIFGAAVQPDLVPQVVVNQDFAAAVFEQYVSAFDRGVVNFTRQEFDFESFMITPRHYWTGGFILEALRTVLSVNSVPTSVVTTDIPSTRVPLWVETEFVTVDDGPERDGPSPLDATPGGIDLDLSRSHRMRTIRVGDDGDFAFGADAIAELVRRRGRAVIPVARAIRPVAGLA